MAHSSRLFTEPARAVLKQILDGAAPAKLEWGLLYDVDDGVDYLTVMTVRKATTEPVTGRRVLQPLGAPWHPASKQ